MRRFPWVTAIASALFGGIAVLSLSFAWVWVGPSDVIKGDEVANITVAVFALMMAFGLGVYAVYLGRLCWRAWRGEPGPTRLF